MDSWKQIRTFTYDADAYVVKNYLESEGIKVFLQDEMTTQVINVVGGVKLMVHADDEKKAIELLHEGGYLKDDE